jgi:hypothetical protein
MFSFLKYQTCDTAMQIVLDDHSEDSSAGSTWLLHWCHVWLFLPPEALLFVDVIRFYPIHYIFLLHS